MAIYHFSLKIIGRSQRGSSIAACAYVSGSVVAGAAYRAGEKIYNDYDKKTHDYTSKTGVVHSEVMLPENAKREYYDRSTLWTAVEKKNNRYDAQLARECEIALPIEFTREEHIEDVKKFITRNLTDRGICADYSIHDKGDGNPHVHILFTMDKVSEKGIGKRLDEERDTAFYKQKRRLNEWREDWARTCNERFQEKGLDIRIDHRTLKAQGLDRQPTIHLGKEASQLEKRGIATARGDENRAIIKRNMQAQAKEAQQNGEQKKLDRRIKQLENDKQDLTDIQEKIDKLRKERISAKNKGGIDRQINEFEESMKQAINQIEREIKQFDYASIREKIEENTKTSSNRSIERSVQKTLEYSRKLVVER